MLSKTKIIWYLDAFMAELTNLFIDLIYLSDSIMINPKMEYAT